MSTAHDVVALGNALVDVIVQVDDPDLVRWGLTKGSMALVDEDGARRLYGEVGPAVERSGGSAANTAVGVVSMGGSAAFVGRVRDDQLGDVFAHDIRAAGVAFTTPPATSGADSGRCLVMVTPDAERTMNTFLGAAAELHADDIDPEVIAGAAVTYLEGYLWDPPQAKEAYRAAIDLAHEADRAVAFSLSDLFCVDRHRDEFAALVSDEIDILFANEAELIALYDTNDVAAALDIVGREVRLAAITLGAAGSVVVAAGKQLPVAARPIAKLVDTTGAGDLYAAGFLRGLTAGVEPGRCGELGAIAAAEVISHVGARPETNLAGLATEAGLLL